MDATPLHNGATGKIVSIGSRDKKMQVTVDIEGAIVYLYIRPPFTRIPNPSETVKLRRCDGWVKIGKHWYTYVGRTEIAEVNEDPGVETESYQKLLQEKFGQLSMLKE